MPGPDMPYGLLYMRVVAQEGFVRTEAVEKREQWERVVRTTTYFLHKTTAV